MRTVRQLLESKGPDVHAIGPDAAVIDAIRQMAEKGIGALVVLEPDGRLAGVVSERDYARKIVLAGRSSRDTPVRDIMSAEVVTVRLDDQAEACMQLVTDRRIRHLPVVEGGRRRLGGDVALQVLELERGQERRGRRDAPQRERDRAPQP